MKDYYKILGVSDSTSQEEIKKAYRKLSKEYHPDKGGNEEKFKEISEAYTNIGDENKRREYDQMRNNPFGGDTFDIFNSFFNQSVHRSRPIKGRDLNMNISVSVEDIYFSKHKKIKYQREKSCNSCNGTGGEWKTCTSCNGVGSFRRVFSNGFMQQVVNTSCSDCNGKGKVPMKLCATCIGKGTNKSEEIFEFQIPKEVRHGDSLTYPRFGDEIPGGVPGTLFVNISINNDGEFKLDVNDLLYVLNVNPLDIMVGKEVTIKRFDSEFNFKLDKLFDPNRKYLIRGKGIDGGDIVVTIKIIPPAEIDDETFNTLVEVKSKLENDLKN
jgi:molecular chaperone DnaJ